MKKSLPAVALASFVALTGCSVSNAGTAEDALTGERGDIRDQMREQWGDVVQYRLPDSADCEETDDDDFDYSCQVVVATSWRAEETVMVTVEETGDSYTVRAYPTEDDFEVVDGDSEESGSTRMFGGDHSESLTITVEK
ncbi:hypothetical protein [Nesterenkonia populi]|uniref:hypothetical protein n=1 Tax=Nesterenkonia populi TaxID=1591087 RepID=UPI0011BF5AB5|nr:hypothetical protein [Nesterenkonia populi]